MTISATKIEKEQSTPATTAQRTGALLTDENPGLKGTDSTASKRAILCTCDLAIKLLVEDVVHRTRDPT